MFVFDTFDCDKQSESVSRYHAECWVGRIAARKEKWQSRIKEGGDFETEHEKLDMAVFSSGTSV